MSIWSSIGDGDEVHGYAVDHIVQGEPTGYVDVATTAPDFNNCIRLGVTEPGQDWGSQVMLDRDNAERLIRHLQTAASYLTQRENAARPEG